MVDRVGADSPVSSHNEWDPLEEIIVGRLEGSTIPSDHPVVTCNIPGMAARAQALAAGFRFPKFMVEPAKEELDHFIQVLESLGVTVTRPDPYPHKANFSTPHWSTRGFCNSFPRDFMLVIGDEILETPMAWPCRYFETFSYWRILKDYFRRGARWISAPKPQLTDELFDPNFKLPEKGEPLRYILTEFEPVFDAADFFCCGRDIFVTRSNVTNALGIEWLRRHLGEGYRIHEIKSRCPNPCTSTRRSCRSARARSFINPEYINPDELPDILKKWDILVAPEPDPIMDRILAITSMCGKWLSMNILMIDEKRMIVDPHHTSMMRQVEKSRFKQIPVPFLHYAAFGGAFHCATLDVRRRAGPWRAIFRRRRPDASRRSPLRWA